MRKTFVQWTSYEAWLENWEYWQWIFDHPPSPEELAYSDENWCLF